MGAQPDLIQMYLIQHSLGQHMAIYPFLKGSSNTHRTDMQILFFTQNSLDRNILKTSSVPLPTLTLLAIINPFDIFQHLVYLPLAEL